MLIRRQFATLLCVIALVLACVAAPAQTGETGTVTGHVYCADTQKPARFVNISLLPIDAHSGRGGHGDFANTGPDGSFRITDVAPGDYYAQVMMTGYLQPVRDIGRDLQDLAPAERERLNAELTRVSVTAGQTVTVQVTVYRGATVSGTVSYDDGSPAAGIRVESLALPPGNQSAVARRPRFGRTAQTDDRGQFRLTGLDDGTFLLLAAPRSIFPIYYGNTVERGSAKRLELRAGEEVSGLDIQIPAAGMHRVSGFVVSQQDGRPVSGAALQMRLSSGEPDSLITAFSAADGSFTFSAVPDGRFTVQTPGASSNGTALEVHGADVTDLIVNTTSRN